MNPTISTKTLGDVVSDTWYIYKGSFWKIITISAIVQILVSIFVAIMFLILVATGVASGFFDEPDPAIFFSGPFIGVMIVFVGVLLTVFLLTYVIMEGAVTHAVIQQYLWHPISVRQAYRGTFNRFWPMLGAVILATLAVFAMAITIIGIPFAVYFGLRWYFMLQTALLEDAGPAEALRGSSKLVAGNWWRVLGITIVVALVISAVTFIPSFIIGFVPFVGPIIVNIFVWPAYTIGKTVLYGDLRLRAEGPEHFNVEVLERDLGMVLDEEEEKGWSKFDPT